MSKFVVLCCMLLPFACCANCAPGTETCNVMDEAALMQKDLSLTQKSLEQPAVDIDLPTVAKHISEALSLQYLTEATKVKLRQAKLLTGDFEDIKETCNNAMKTIKERGSPKMNCTVLARDDPNITAKQCEESGFGDFFFYSTDGLTRMVATMDSELDTADAYLAESKLVLENVFADFEQLTRTSYADQVTLLAVDHQRSGQAHLIREVVKGELQNMAKAFGDYKATGIEYDHKKYAILLPKVNNSIRTIASTLDAIVQKNEKKLQELEDAKPKYTFHSAEKLNKALAHLISVDESKGRSEVAQHLDSGFQPREAEYTAAIKTFESDSKKTKTDFQTLRSGIEEVLEKTESMIKSVNDVDKKEGTEAYAAVMAAYTDLPDEGDLVQKVMRLVTHTGRGKLTTDLLEVLHEQQKKLKDAFDAYGKSYGSADQDKAFGKMHQQLMLSLEGLKTEFAKFVKIGTAKEEELKDDNLQLNAFMKQ